MAEMKAWHVSRDHRRFYVPHLQYSMLEDVVYYQQDMTVEEVKDSLVEHYGYPPGITVKEWK